MLVNYVGQLCRADHFAARLHHRELGPRMNAVYPDSLQPWVDSFTRAQSEIFFRYTIRAQGWTDTNGDYYFSTSLSPN